MTLLRVRSAYIFFHVKEEMGVRIPPAAPVKRRLTMQTKPVILKNSVNGEQWICDDAKKIKVIDGVSYLTVHKPESYRMVLMRKDSLIPLKTR